MRGSRGLIGSLGAGVSLAAAGSLALLIVSAVVAFKGWPGVSQGTDGRPVTLPSSIRESAPSRVPARIVLGGGVPAAAVGAAGRGRGLRGVALAGTAEQISANPSPAPATSGASDRPDVPVPAAAPTAPAPGPPPVTTPPVDGVVGPPGEVGRHVGGTVQQATGDAGAAIQQTAAGAGDAVRPAAPGAAGAVEQAGDAASGLVQGAGDRLDGLFAGH